MPSVIRGNDNFDSATVGSTTLGAVGTYGFVWVTSGNYSAGTTFASSSLQWSNTGDGAENGSSGVTVPAGTWRVMGSVGKYKGGNNTNTGGYRTTLAVRIS